MTDKFAVIEIPENAYERRNGNPFIDELHAALAALPDGKALLVDVPQGKIAKNFALNVVTVHRSGRFRNSFQVRSSLRPENKVAFWVKKK